MFKNYRIRLKSYSRVLTVTMDIVFSKNLLYFFLIYILIFTPCILVFLLYRKLYTATVLREVGACLFYIIIAETIISAYKQRDISLLSITKSCIKNIITTILLLVPPVICYSGYVYLFSYYFGIPNANFFYITSLVYGIVYMYVMFVIPVRINEKSGIIGCISTSIRLVGQNFFKNSGMMLTIYLVTAIAQWLITFLIFTLCQLDPTLASAINGDLIIFYAVTPLIEIIKYISYTLMYLYLRENSGEELQENFD